jgi:hypothetical protein
VAIFESPPLGIECEFALSSFQKPSSLSHVPPNKGRFRSALIFFLS